MKKGDLVPAADGKGFEWKSPEILKAYRRKTLERVYKEAAPPGAIEEAKWDFADSAYRDAGLASSEYRPGKTTDLLPGMAKETDYGKLADYHQAMDKVFYDDQGHDIISKALGLPTLECFTVPSAYLDQFNPSNQLQIPMPKAGQVILTREGKKWIIDPSVRELVDAYIAIKGLLTHQDSMGWHRPFWTDVDGATVRDANGIKVDLGRSLTLDETVAMKNAAGGRFPTDFFIAGDGTGLRFITTSGNNLLFHNAVKQAASSVFRDLPEFRVKRFVADTGYIENDWKVNPNGEVYRRRLGEQGRSDVLGRLEAELGPSIQRVNEEYAQKYGW
jgi:hypothetical protein